MTRLTAAELREPDVWVSMPIEKWNELPQEVRDLLRFFATRDNITSIEFRLPAYRWREVQAMAGVTR